MAEKGHQGLDLRELAGLVGKRWQGPGFSEEGRRRAWVWFRYGAVPERRKLLRAGVFALGDIGCRSDGADWSESVRVSMRASVSVTAEGKDTSNEVEGGVFSESVFFPQLWDAEDATKKLQKQNPEEKPTI